MKCFKDLCKTINGKSSRKHALILISVVLLTGLFFGKFRHGLAEPTAEQQQKKASTQLPKLPTFIPEPDEDGVIRITTQEGQRRPLTINPTLQKNLTEFIKNHGNHIAAVSVVNPRNGHLLALAQGQRLDEYGKDLHLGLFPKFPAASLFKTVSTTAAIEMANVDADEKIGLVGGCGYVNSRGVWLKDVPPTRRFNMSLRKAYALSCNGYYARLAVNHLGVGIVTDFARGFGWLNHIDSDFYVPESPINIPRAQGSSIHTIGKFAAGFGMVGISAAHASWMSMIVANGGIVKPLIAFADSNIESNIEKRIFSDKTGEIVRSISQKTTNGGTASSAFRRRRYRKLRIHVGGKTGTLTGKSPAGLTTWFTGYMPIEKPLVVVSAVIVATDKWYLKGINLGAEALRQWYDLNKEEFDMAVSETVAQKP